MASFDLWVMEGDDELLVFRAAPPEGTSNVVKQTFHLKSPPKQLYAQEAERLQWVMDPLAGLQRDPGLRAAAVSVAFLSGWTLPQDLSMAGFAEVHPALADAVAAEVLARVYPNPVTSPFARRCWSSAPAGPERGSEAPA